MMVTATPALPLPEGARLQSLLPARSARGADVRAASAIRQPTTSEESPFGEDPPVRVLVVFEGSYRSYRDAIAGVIKELRPHAEVSVAEPASLRAEVARLSPHLVISSQPSAQSPARTVAWVSLPHEPDLAGEICFGDRCVEVRDVDLGDLLAVFDEVEGLVLA